MDRFWKIAQQQGWNDQSVVQILTAVLVDEGKVDALVAHAQRVANEENSYWGNS